MNYKTSIFVLLSVITVFIGIIIAILLQPIDIYNVDLCHPSNLNNATISALNSAIYEHGFVILKNQCAQNNHVITSPQYENIAKWFGTPAVYGVTGSSGSKFITEFTNNTTRSARETGSKGWHIDGTMFPKPNTHCLMYVQSAPNRGFGETQFVYSPDLLDQIRSTNPELYALWNRLLFWTKGFSIHPVIALHPYSNREYMVIHTAFTQQFIEVLDDSKMEEVHEALNGRYYFAKDIKQMVEEYETMGVLRVHSKAETKEMLNRMRREIEESGLVLVTEYENGDLLIRDNLVMLHVADPTAKRPVEEIGHRKIWRISTEGDHVPTKYL